MSRWPTIRRRALIKEDAILARIAEADTSGHPGFPHDAVSRMMDEKLGDDPYPRKRLLPFDRVRADGHSWVIRLYLPFTQAWSDAEFLGLHISTADAARMRVERM